MEILCYCNENNTGELEYNNSLPKENKLFLLIFLLSNPDLVFVFALFVLFFFFFIWLYIGYLDFGKTHNPRL